MNKTVKFVHLWLKFKGFFKYSFTGFLYLAIPLVENTAL